MNADKFNYIIYHKYCFDGFAGFYLFMKSNQWVPKPIVYPDVPHAKSLPPNIDNKNVIIIDVAYNPRIIQQIAKRANKLLFIDHHISIADDINKLELQPPHHIIYDESSSGASLVWKHFHGSDSDMPTFVKYIEDNDTGTWQYAESIPFMIALEVEFPFDHSLDNLKHWDKLLDNAFVDQLLLRGQSYNRYRNVLVNKNASRYTLLRFPSQTIVNRNLPSLKRVGQYKVAVLNVACPSITLIGKRILETVDCDFVLVWSYMINRKKYVVSLRSKNIDISLITKHLGGGGHRYAGSFSFNSSKLSIDDLFVPTQKFSYHR